MIRTLKILSAALTYPEAELLTAVPELKEILRREKLLPRHDLDAVCGFLDDLAGHDLFDAQERYVFLFDRTRSLSLHLFEHVHGESRDRGAHHAHGKHSFGSSRPKPDRAPSGSAQRHPTDAVGA